MIPYQGVEDDHHGPDDHTGGLVQAEGDIQDLPGTVELGGKIEDEKEDDDEGGQHPDRRLPFPVI